VLGRDFTGFPQLLQRLADPDDTTWFDPAKLHQPLQGSFYIESKTSRASHVQTPLELEASLSNWAGFLSDDELQGFRYAPGSLCVRLSCQFGNPEFRALPDAVRIVYRNSIGNLFRRIFQV